MSHLKMRGAHTLTQQQAIQILLNVSIGFITNWNLTIFRLEMLNSQNMLGVLNLLFQYIGHIHEEDGDDDDCFSNF